MSHKIVIVFKDNTELSAPLGDYDSHTGFEHWQNMFMSNDKGYFYLYPTDTIIRHDAIKYVKFEECAKNEDRA